MTTIAETTQNMRSAVWNYGKIRIPNLRFPWFSGEWEERRLGELAKFSKWKDISKEDVVEDGNIECIRYWELYTYYKEVITEIISKTMFKEDLVLSNYNDVIIPSSWETHIDIATASCVLRDGVALWWDLTIIKTRNNGIFLSYYLNGARKFDIAKLAQWISVIHLYQDHLKQLNLHLPTLPEQQKIADFLTVVDEKLQTLTQFKKSREEYKKAVMQRLFSGEVRFPGFSGGREEVRLGEIGEIRTWNLNVQDAIEDWEFTFFDRSEEIKKYNQYTFDNEAIIYAGEWATFFPRYFKGKYGLHQRSYSIFNVRDMNMKYLYYFMQTQNNHFLRMAVGSTVKSLRMDCFEKCKILIPSLPEQEKIANCLSALDNKIEKITLQFNAVQQWKRGLLQGLFV